MDCMKLRSQAMQPARLAYRAEEQGGRMKAEGGRKRRAIKTTLSSFRLHPSSLLFDYCLE
jgi:hypothetical protein